MPEGADEVVIRPAVVGDVPAIVALINSAAEYGLMLPRSVAQVYETVREYVVAVDGGAIVGCGALSVIGAGAGEITGLAVDASQRGSGLGRRLVEACLDDAGRLGVGRVMALTFERGFFERLGFEAMDSGRLPEKLWAQSVRCAKVGAEHGRQEVAMVRVLDGVPGAGEATAEMTAALEYRVPFVMKRLGKSKD
ncbi:MAG: GNAT family N-acetyltransferase [Planctomycetota bacterium]